MYGAVDGPTGRRGDVMDGNVQMATNALAQSGIQIAKLSEAQKTQILSKIEQQLGNRAPAPAGTTNFMELNVGCIACTAGLNVVGGVALAAAVAAGAAVAPEAAVVVLIADFFGASAASVATVINAGLRAGAGSAVENIIGALCHSFGAC
jgi:hypothetical protein